MKTQDSDDALTTGLRAVAEDDERLWASSSAVGMRLMAEVQAIGARGAAGLALLSLERRRGGIRSPYLSRRQPDLFPHGDD